jgi:hypothetical protein
MRGASVSRRSSRAAAAARKSYYEAVTTDNLVRMRELDMSAAEATERRRVFNNQVMSTQMAKIERQELLRQQITTAQSPRV